jgi:hypothetical protein
VDRCSFTASDLRLYFLPGSPAHAARYKGGVACKIAPNTGLNLVAVQPDVLQLVVGHVPELRDGHPLQAPIHVAAPPAPKAPACSVKNGGRNTIATARCA